MKQRESKKLSVKEAKKIRICRGSRRKSFKHSVTFNIQKNTEPVQSQAIR